MTLVVVLWFGLGVVLIVSAIETDPATGKSVSVLKTISDIWNDRVDFTQPATPGAASANGGRLTTTAAPTSPLTFQQASTANFLAQHAA